MAQLRLSKREVEVLRRRLAAERMRARSAEAELDRLRPLLDGPPSLRPHLRAAVETRNGSLLHHDGGIEQTTHGLACLVEQADVVVCPIDCVSHNACLRVKGLCRRMGKPFVPMRSAGATSFARMLRTLNGAAAGTPDIPPA